MSKAFQVMSLRNYFTVNWKIDLFCQFSIYMYLHAKSELWYLTIMCSVPHHGVLCKVLFCECPSACVCFFTWVLVCMYICMILEIENTAILP